MRIDFKQYLKGDVTENPFATSITEKCIVVKNARKVGSVS